MIYNDDIAAKDLMNGIEKADIAFQWVYDKYIHQLRLLAARKTGCMETAKDIVQDLFVKLWENRKRKMVVSWEPYLNKSLNNAILDYWKFNRVRLDYAQSISENRGESQIPDSDNPESILIEKEHADSMEKVMALLPKHHRQILEMVLYDGLSYDEISEKLGIPPGSVGPKIIRAKNEVLKYIEYVNVTRLGGGSIAKIRKKRKE